MITEMQNKIVKQKCEKINVWWRRWNNSKSSDEADTLFLSELTILLFLMKWTLLGSAFLFSFNSSESFLKALLSSTDLSGQM